MNGFRPRSLSEYGFLLWRNKFLITVTAGVVMWAAWITINRLPNVYESEALVVLAGLQTEEGRQAAAAKVTHLTQRVTSRAALLPVIERYHLYQGASADAQISQMRKALKVETRMRNYYPEVAEAVTISFRHNDPAVAQGVLNDLMSIFKNTNESVAQQASLEERDLRAKIAEVENQMRQTGARRGVPRLGFDPREVRMERNVAAASVETLEDRQYSLEQQIKEQKRQIGEQQRLIQSAPLPTLTEQNNPNNAYGTLLVRRAELEAQLKDYATQYTEKNPKVVQTRNQIAEINRQVAQLNSRSDGQAQIASTLATSLEGRELRALERDLARLQTELEVTRRELGRRKQTLVALPEVKPGLAATLDATFTNVTPGVPGGSAELGFLQNRYVALLDQQDKMQRALATPVEFGLAPFQIVDQPNLPQAPVGPNRSKFKLIALGLALLCGLAVVAALEGPRLRLIQDERDAEYFFGTRVVALIPETLTPDERGNQRRLMLTRKLALFLFAAASVPVVALLLYTASRYFT